MSESDPRERRHADGSPPHTVRAVLSSELGPERDIARAAMRHLRVRYVAIVSINEVLATFATIVRSITNAMSDRRHE